MNPESSKVCFLPDAIRKNQRRMSTESRFRIVFTCVTLVIVALCTMSDLRIRKIYDLDQQVNERLAVYENRVLRCQELARREKLLTSQIDEYVSLRPAALFSTAMAQVCNSVPEGLKLERMTIASTGDASQPLSVNVSAQPERRLDGARLVNAIALLRNVSDVRTTTLPNDPSGAGRIQIQYKSRTRP